MKLVLILIAVFSFTASSKTFSQQVTLSVKQASLETVMHEIRKQSGYAFIFNTADLRAAKRVTAELKDASIEQTMEFVFANQPFTYEIEEGTIVVKLNKRKNVSTVVQVLPQTITANGRVVDTLLNPLEGASIRVKGSRLSTSTDHNGAFSLKDVPVGGIIEFSHMGFITREIKAHGNMGIIVLSEVVSELDEVQVIAYGTTTRRLSTGNVVTVKGEDIARQPLLNPLVALQGLVPGLLIEQNPTSASAPVRVELRGPNSINPMHTTEPLYIIDGVVQTMVDLDGYQQDGVSSGVVQAGWSASPGQSVLFGLNADDIESITVLKDADATAIYGSRAANGVILITTKKGIAGRTRLSLNVQHGVEKLPKYPKVFELEKYLAIRREAFDNAFLSPSIDNALDLIYWDTTRNHTSMKALMNEGHHSRISGSLMGGDRSTTFRLSGNYTNTTQLYQYTGGNQAASVSLSVSHASPSNRLRAELSATYGQTKVDGIFVNANYFQPPNAPPVFDELGNLNYLEWTFDPNDNRFPYKHLLEPYLVKNNSLNAAFSLSYRLLKGLRLNGRFVLGSNNGSNDGFSPLAAADPRTNPVSISTFGSTKTFVFGVDPSLSYEALFGKARLNVLIGGDLQSTTTEGSTLMGMGFESDDLMRNVTNAMIRDVAGSSFVEYKYAALFGRLNFNWDAKYVLNLNFRRDGSSRFAPGRQFGNFGSLGLAWITSDEHWLREKLPAWVSLVKFRGSYGITGSDRIGDYQYLSRYSNRGNNQMNLLPSYDGRPGYTPVIPKNQQYRWESLNQLELAMDVGFWEDRIALGLAWYRKRSGSQLTQIPTPIYTGFSRVTANWDANVQNSGLEAVFSLQGKPAGEIKWNLAFNIGRNWNKLIAYPGIEDSPYAAKYKVGQSIRTQYVLGFLGVDPLTGEYAYEDYDKNGRVTENPRVLGGTEGDDRYIGIDLTPKYQGGLQMAISWRALALTAGFFFSKQMDLHPSYANGYGGMTNYLYSNAILRDRWQHPGDPAKYARFDINPIIARGSVLVDASHIGLNNLSLNYALSKSWLERTGLESLRLGVSTQNLYIWSLLNLYEPELIGGSLRPAPTTIVGNLSFNF